MSGQAFQAVLDSLADQFGRLDNQVERWAEHHQGLTGLFPEITAALQSSFPQGSAPQQIFALGSQTYLDLQEELAGKGGAELPRSFLNLRFFILLNGFLLACQEAQVKAAANPSLDPAELVEKSYYTPYFFARASSTREAMIEMLQAEIAQMLAVPQDGKGILMAMRMRNGVVTTLAETYCPTHPMLYPLVQELDAIKASSDPIVIDWVKTQLENILAAI